MVRAQSHGTNRVNTEVASAGVGWLVCVIVVVHLVRMVGAPICVLGRRWFIPVVVINPEPCSVSLVRFGAASHTPLFFLWGARYGFRWAAHLYLFTSVAPGMSGGDDAG